MAKMIAIYEDNLEVWEDDLGNQITTEGRVGGEYSYEPGKIKKRRRGGKTRFPLDWPDCDTLNRAEQYYTQNVNKSNMKHENNVFKIHDGECGVAARAGRKPLLTTEQVVILNKLVCNLLYRNTVWMSSEDMSMVLGVNNNKIRRELLKLKGIVKIVNTKKGEWRVDVNPMYGFKYPISEHGMAKDACFNEWLSSKLIECS